MPIFEYRCEKCGKRSEFLETTGKGSSRRCSNCDSTELQKLISTFTPQAKAGESKRCHGCADYKCPYAGN